MQRRAARLRAFISRFTRTICFLLYKAAARLRARCSWPSPCWLCQTAGRRSAPSTSSMSATQASESVRDACSTSAVGSLPPPYRPRQPAATRAGGEPQRSLARLARAARCRPSDLMRAPSDAHAPAQPCADPALLISFFVCDLDADASGHGVHADRASPEIHNRRRKTAAAASRAFISAASMS